MCARHAGKNANELTLPEQGDKIYYPPDYSVFDRLISFSIFYFLFVVQFDVLCLQRINNYFNSTNRKNYPKISGEDLSVTVPEKSTSTCF